MHETKLFENFTEEELCMIWFHIDSKRHSLSAGEVLYFEGDIVDSYWIVSSGKVQACKQKQNGDYYIDNIFYEGDVIGLDIANTRTQTSPFLISSVDKSILFELPHSVSDNELFPQTLKDKLTHNILSILASDNIDKQYRIDILHETKVKDRIMKYMCYQCVKNASLEFEIDMNRESLSKVLGMNRSVLSHQLTKLKKEGLISFRKKRYKVINPMYFLDQYSATIFKENSKK